MNAMSPPRPPGPRGNADQLERSLQALIALIEAHQRFLVVGHHGPDGDAIGSTLALGLLLEQLGKDVVFFNQDPVPYNLTFLPGADRVTSALPDDAAIEVTILLDCAEPARVGPRFPEAGWGETTVVVDHHRTWDPDFADLYVRDIHAAATGEIVHKLVKRCGALTPEIAHNLYCCVMTDTGSFRYSNTSQETFTIAGELVAAGVDAWFMTSHIYESQPRERVVLLCRVLDTLSVSDDGRLAFLRIERRMIDGIPDGDQLLDGFINYARAIRGVEVATQLREAGPDDWTVSFRSRGGVDVSALAGRFGGGGHHNAAGCRIQGTPAQIEARLTRALVDLLDG